MGKQKTRTAIPAATKPSLRRRIRLLYEAFNAGDWAACFKSVDPKLRQMSRIEAPKHSQSLAAFRQRYGSVNIWHVRVNVYSEAKNKHDDRPFAYAYVFW